MPFSRALHLLSNCASFSYADLAKEKFCERGPATFLNFAQAKDTNGSAKRIGKQVAREKEWNGKKEEIGSLGLLDALDWHVITARLALDCLKYA